MRSLLYLTGRTPSPFPAEPEHLDPDRSGSQTENSTSRGSAIGGLGAVSPLKTGIQGPRSPSTLTSSTAGVKARPRQQSTASTSARRRPARNRGRTADQGRVYRVPGRDREAVRVRSFRQCCLLVQESESPLAGQKPPYCPAS